MKFLNNLKSRFEKLIYSVSRYPLTAIFLLAASIIAIISIYQDKNYSKLLFTCAMGAVSAVTAQAVYERFFEKISIRFALMLGSVLIAAVYYVLIKPLPDMSMIVTVKTSALLSAMITAYIWIPSIKREIKFEQCFMAFFKAFFLSLFYSVIIMGGCSAIIAAIDNLIYALNPDAYAYAADIIFILFAPLLLFSLIPEYSKAQSEHDNNIAKAVDCPKFFQVLLIYIIIPVISIYTIILLIYIVMNIGSSFWSNNLLEPLLITYSIAVILTYILTVRLENKIVKIFLKVFPKVLIAIVLFQTAATVINLGETGITSGRYYVILFAVFAAVSGVVMCFKNRRNGIIAAAFIILCIISVTPPVDAFTTSKISQTNRLENVLIKNEMLKDDKVIPNAKISNEDKKRIIRSVEQLSAMGYIKEIPWLGEEFERARDFNAVFGFNEYDLPGDDRKDLAVFLDVYAPLDIAGYDVMMSSFVSNRGKGNQEIITVNYLDKSYRFITESSEDKYDLVFIGSEDKEIIRFDTGAFFARYENYNTPDKSGITEKDASFFAENDAVKIKFIVKNLFMNADGTQTYFDADFYILIDFK